MITVNLHEAKTHFSELVEKAMNGETVIVCKRNTPVIELTPVKKKGKFRIGGSKYKFNIPKEVFAPLKGEELEDWYRDIDL